MTFFFFTKDDQNGFTLLGVLFLTAVLGISLMGTTRYWSTVVKREKEKELLYRGDQIRKGIASYYNASGGAGAYPRTLDDLLKDPRSLTVKRHLRKIYRDPMTQDGKWGLIIAGSGRVKGVYSKHNGIPLKKAGFPEDYAEFEKAKTYSDWRFVYHEIKSKK